MKASSLQLESSAVTRLHIEATKDLKGVDPAERFTAFGEADLGSTVEISADADTPHRHVVRLQVRLPGSEVQATPYAIDIEIYGIFHCHGPDHQHDETLLAVNAPAVLYGSVRELVMSATARGPYPMMVLPTVNFIDDGMEVAADGRRLTPTNP